MLLRMLLVFKLFFALLMIAWSNEFSLFVGVLDTSQLPWVFCYLRMSLTLAQLWSRNGNLSTNCQQFLKSPGSMQASPIGSSSLKVDCWHRTKTKTKYGCKLGLSTSCQIITTKAWSCSAQFVQKIGSSDEIVIIFVYHRDAIRYLPKAQSLALPPDAGKIKWIGFSG